MLTCCEVSIFFQPSKNVKTILSWWTDKDRQQVGVTYCSTLLTPALE